MATDGSNEELYGVVCRAVSDALWNVVGTVTLAGVLVVVFFVGLSILSSAATAGGAGGSIVGVVLGTAIAGGTAFGFAWPFDLLPWS
jgi:hypothetical protein